MSKQIKKTMSLLEKREKTGLLDPNYVNNKKSILIEPQLHQLFDKWSNTEIVDSGSLKPRHYIILESEEKKL
jgi:hypothetical protein